MFDWDPGKGASNALKHGVTFEEATTVFADERALDGPDAAHSTRESRRLRLGRSTLGRVPVVAYTLREEPERGEQTIRIISARRANRKERPAYEAG